MFSSIKINNFQVFGEETEIPLAPITLIFGPNASGKSAFIRALLLLRQSLNSASGTENGLQFAGEDVDLNGFKSVVHGQIDQRIMRQQKLSIGITAAAVELGLKISGIDKVSINLEVGYSPDDSGKQIPHVINVTQAFFDDKVRQGDLVGVEFVMCAAGETRQTGYLRPMFDSTTKADQFLVDVDAHDALEAWCSSQSAVNWSEDDDKLLIPDSDDFEPEGWNSIFDEFAQISGNFLRLKRAKNPLNEETLIRINFLTEFFSQVRIGFLGNLMNANHIGPIRRVPQLVNTGTTLDNLSSKNANSWLLRITNGRYEVKQFQVGLEEHAQDIWVNLVVDNFTGTFNTFADVGTGISQVYPVISAAMPDRIRRWGSLKNEIVIIEQPELHLHPSAQSSLGDLFTECVKDESRNVQFLIETHSENLLLRIQKNIREGKLSNSDVSIIFVEPLFDPELGPNTDGYVKTVARQLRLDNAGDVLDPFPVSFADLRIQDLL